MALIDLSAPIKASPPELPEPLRTEIEFQDHAAGAGEIERLLGVGPELLRDREGWATETFTRFGTHNSTHVDARGTTTPRSAASPPRRSTSCRSTGSSPMASCST